MDLPKTHSKSSYGNRASGTTSTDEPLAHEVEKTDEELISQFSTMDDTVAFELLVHRYENELFSYLRRYLGSTEMAEDVFQATFLQVHLNTAITIGTDVLTIWCNQCRAN